MHPEELRETIQDYLDSLEITRGLEDMLEEDVLELIMRRLLVENGLEMEQEEEIRAIVREELERRKGIIEEEHEEEEESKEEEEKEEEQKERTRKWLPSP